MFKKLMQPGESLEFPQAGSWVRLDKGSKVQIKTDLNQVGPLYERDSSRFNPFRSITITNQSAQAETVEIRVSDGQIVSAGDGAVMAISSQGNTVQVSNLAEISMDGATVSVGNVGITGEVMAALDTTTVADVLDIPIDSGASAQIMPANANRKEIIIQVSAGVNLCTARVGGATVNTGRGAKVLAGAGILGSITLETSGLVRIYNEGPDTITVSAVEVTR